MRVGLAIETDSPGGAEVMLLELAREIQSRGHDVVGLGPEGGEGWVTDRLSDLGIERDLVEFRGPFQLGTVPQVASIVRSRRLDVLHSHEFGMAVCGALATRFTGCRHVITMHGGMYYASAVRRRHGLRLAMALSQGSVVVSEASRRSLVGMLGVREGSVSVVHNGVAPRVAEGQPLRDELGLAGEDILVVAVGNLLPVKGHSILLEAFSRLPPHAGRIVLAIAGRGPEEADLRARAAALGIERELYLLGYRADIPELLGSADVFAMPSLSEGLPMALIEAMLAGCAIVASDAGGIPELLPSAEYGFVSSAGDVTRLTEGLASLVGDPDRRQHMGAAARERALQHFTAAAMADRYLSIYAGVDGEP